MDDQPSPCLAVRSSDGPQFRLSVIMAEVHLILAKIYIIYWNINTIVMYDVFNKTNCGMEVDR